jgi:hypothetical protein
MIILFLLIIPLFVYAQETVIDNSVAISELRNTVINEDIKTRQELKRYMDVIVDDVVNKALSQGQKFFEDNFRVLESRLHTIGNQLLMKFYVGIVASIIFSQGVWFLIKRRIESLKSRKLIKRQYEYVSPTVNPPINPTQTYEQPLKVPLPPTPPIIPQKDINDSSLNKIKGGIIGV